jgi:hypothetical protein
LEKQKVALKDKKLRMPVNGKFTDICSSERVIKYLFINVQNIKIHLKNITVQPLFENLKKKYLKERHSTHIPSLTEDSKVVPVV